MSSAWQHSIINHPIDNTCAQNATNRYRIEPLNQVLNILALHESFCKQAWFLACFDASGGFLTPNKGNGGCDRCQVKHASSPRHTLILIHTYTESWMCFSCWWSFTNCTIVKHHQITIWDKVVVTFFPSITDANPRNAQVTFIHGPCFWGVSQNRGLPWFLCLFSRNSRIPICIDSVWWIMALHLYCSIYT